MSNVLSQNYFREKLLLSQRRSFCGTEKGMKGYCCMDSVFVEMVSNCQWWQGWPAWDKNLVRGRKQFTIIDKKIVETGLEENNWCKEEERKQTKWDAYISENYPISVSSIKLFMIFNLIFHHLQSEIKLYESAVTDWQKP